MQPPPEGEQPETAPVPAEQEEAKPSSYLTVQKGVIRITNVNSKPVDLAQTQSSSPTPGPGAAAEAPAAPVI